MSGVEPSAAEPIEQRIKALGQSLGFQQVGIAEPELTQASERLKIWLGQGRHGSMAYMEKHGSKRWIADQLVPGTLSVISVRMDYFPPDIQHADTQLQDSAKAYISRYALGRDYHKLMRNRLQQFAERLQAWLGPIGHRVFVDSAPVMEKPLAEKAGLGWIGKHTNLINSKAGSWFFLGEIFIDRALQPDVPSDPHCGSCTRCITACPTAAIVAPFELDARLCISYLTIEFDGVIPEALRAPMGNRIYGCDDCQLVCPWNKFARLTGEPDFRARHQLDSASLLELFAWSEAEFLQKTEGSAIRRIGYARWQRNLAIALGNSDSGLAHAKQVVAALELRLRACTGSADAAEATEAGQNLAEHLNWALRQQRLRFKL